MYPITVEDIETIVVLRHYESIAHTKFSLWRNPHALPIGIQSLLQGMIEGLRSDGADIERSQDLNVSEGVDSQRRGNFLGYQFDYA